MKNILRIFCLLSLISGIASSQSGWVFQNPLPTGNNLKKVRFLNNYFGYSVGEFGTVIKTINQGANWTNVSINTKSTINGMHFRNLNNGIAVGNNSSIYKTINGGVNWINCSPVNDTADFEDVVMFDANTGIAVSNKRNNSAVFRTINGGLNWTRLSSPLRNFTNNAVSMMDADNAFIFGTDIDLNTFSIIKSSDKGTTWNTSFTTDSIEFFNSFKLDENTVFAMGRTIKFFYIVKTTNSGASWSVEQCNNSIIPFGITLKQCAFVNQLTGYCAGYQSVSALIKNRVYKTTDGGVNWVPAQLNDSLVTLSGVWADNNRVYTVGQGGYIARSLNSGGTFSRAFRTLTMQAINDVSFINNNTGIVVGAAGEIYKTINGGTNWVRQYIDSAFAITGCKLVDANTGYISTAARIYKTTNGGSSWVKVLIVNAASWNDIDAPNADYCAVAGGCPNAYVYTTNGGTTWEGTTTGVSCNPGPVPIEVTTMFELAMPSPNLVSLIGSTNYPHAGSVPKAFLKRGTGFLNTIYIGELQTPVMTTIDFYDSLTGFISGNYKVRMKTTNGGLNWVDYGENQPGYGPLHIVRFATRTTLYGEGGNIKSTDGGETWFDIPFITNGISDMDCASEQTVYSVGSFGKIVKTDVGGLVAMGNEGEMIPGSYSLQQNFPNPFNPVTKINFNIPLSNGNSRTMLVIYDILGREIRTLVNSILPAGEHSVDFNASELPSGVYFYKLTSGDFTDTKKMVLIK